MSNQTPLSGTPSSSLYEVVFLHQEDIMAFSTHRLERAAPGWAGRKTTVCELTRRAGKAAVFALQAASFLLAACVFLLGDAGRASAADSAAPSAVPDVSTAKGASEAADPSAAVIAEVEKRCLDETIYMIGVERAKRLAELVRQRKPTKVVECGTAIGYSALWIARELEKTRTAEHQPKLITIEIDPKRAKEAQEYFRRAKLDHLIEVKVGDAKKVIRDLQGPIDFVFIDCNGPNYFGCIDGLKDKLSPGAVIVADNAGVSAASMKDYLDFVRKNFDSRTEWFDMDLPWGKRDAMEISIVPKQTKPAQTK